MENMNKINIERHRLRVKKRDGSLVPVRVDAITDRIDAMCNVPPVLDFSLDPFQITQEVVSKIHDGISTSELDSFTADICATKSLEHPHYGLLASRLIVSDHHKNISSTTGILFSQVCEALYNNKDQLGHPCPLINESIYRLTKSRKEQIDNLIDLDRDFHIDFFGFKTLCKSYLLKVNNGHDHLNIVETPQHMFLRVALGIHIPMSGDVSEDDITRAKETYDLMSLKYFTHATPTLYNSGTKNPQVFSCFLLGMEDSLAGIYKCLTDTAHISKWSGGIGIHISDIRANGSYIRGTAGKSDGIVPMLRVFNDTARYVNQSGRRLGSFAMYIEPWHADIIDFLKCNILHLLRHTCLYTFVEVLENKQLLHLEELLFSDSEQEPSQLLRKALHKLFLLENNIIVLVIFVFVLEIILFPQYFSHLHLLLRVLILN
jgi:ribonucleoside-diphosphate reductase alpha chain